MIDGQKVFDQPVRNDLITYDNIRTVATGGCLLDYIYFKKFYKMVAIDLSKKQVLDTDPKSVQQINLTLKISSNVVGDSYDENNFPYKLVLTNAQVSKLRKAFANNSSANIELS